MKRISFKLIVIFFSLTLANAQDLPSNVPTQGLEAYYPFKGNANDASGNGHDGTVNGATLTADKDGNTNSAYSFDGVSNTIGFDSSFFNGQQVDSFTLFARFNVLNLEDSPSIWGKALNWGEVNFYLPSDNSVALMWANSVNGNRYSRVESSNNSISNSEWIDVAITFENQQLKVYKNGALINSTMSYTQQGGGFISDSQVEGSCNFAQDAGSNKIGMRLTGGNPGNYFEGAIDDFGIWNRALTLEEIQNLHSPLTGDIVLNGVTSIENNQIKNLADPTDAQDAATKTYVDDNINTFSGSYNDLTDVPTTYTQSEVDALILNLQSQISDLKGEVVDNEGNVYSSVQLGDQLWTTINAENTTYRDGTAIPQVTDLNTWPNLTTGAWCYIDNDPSKGKLYNWFAVVGIHNEASLTDTSLRKEFAPQGWKIPSNDDFSLLVNYLIANGYNHDGTVTGNKLAKSLASQSGWGVTTGNGLPGTDQSLNNSSGFNALPVGVYMFNGTGWYFLNKGSEADFWTLTEHESAEDLARYAALIFDRDWLTQWYIPKNNGASVRFIKE